MEIPSRSAIEAGFLFHLEEEEVVVVVVVEERGRSRNGRESLHGDA
jgi:hypothetical protein